MKTEFFMHMIPPTITAQQHKVRVTKKKVPVFYDPPELATAKSKLEAHLAKHVYEKHQGAVELVVKWCFPIAGRHRDGDYRTSKPDLDNLQKALKDCITRLGFWIDDAYVVREISEKFWADVPGIYIRITDIGDDNA
ncbi:MAG: RusA family crossover junction endodeoxyribonuclease [Clostridiales Family XIII bacterium]|jgi:Holliday junction resolvase RusA-like endonuclease|nr:RusA family crossover junction endodeoxyribonuclease [Clostridiales Family XIII bacterium]